MIASTAVQSIAKSQGWDANLKLAFSKRGGKTVLLENSHKGPLRVQRPLYPEDEVCHTYILHPPGGVVGGDTLTLNLEVNKMAHALLTTPGATKFYRSTGATAKQSQSLLVKGGTLEWFPQDNIVFSGAVMETSTEIALTDRAQFIGWEVLCLGLPTQNKTFQSGRVSSRLSLLHDGKPLFLDRLHITAAHDSYSASGMREYPVTGTFIATNFSRDMLADLRQECELDVIEDALVGATTVNEVLVVRYLGTSTFGAREVFTKVWQWLRPLMIQKKAVAPRIWLT